MSLKPDPPVITASKESIVMQNSNEPAQPDSSMVTQATNNNHVDEIDIESGMCDSEKVLSSKLKFNYQNTFLK